MGKLATKKIWLVTLTIIGVLLMSTPTFAANQVEADGTVIADKEHLDILNSLRGTNVSYGEVIEKVFPEAAAMIPEEILADMYKQPFCWDSSKCEITFTNEPLETPELNSVGAKSAPLILYTGGSSIGIGNPITFESDTVITFPSGYRVPFISAVSLLYKQGETDCIASATKSYNNASAAVATGKKFNPSTGTYRPQGSHYIVFPEGFVTPYTTFGTASTWQTYP